MKPARSKLLDLPSADSEPIRDTFVFGDKARVRRDNRRELLAGGALPELGCLVRLRQRISFRTQHSELVIQLPRALLGQLERRDVLGLTCGRLLEPCHRRSGLRSSRSRGLPDVATKVLEQAAHTRARRGPGAGP